MKALETLERMTLDLMVKGVIDYKELKPLLYTLQRVLSPIEEIKPLIFSLEEKLSESFVEKDDKKNFKEILQLLDKIGKIYAETKAGKSGESDIPKRLTYNPKVDPAIVENFQLEVEEQLHSMERDLLLLERSLENEGTEQLVRTIMGYLHSIKGVAGFLEFDSMQKITHVAESALTSYAGKKIPEALCDALFRTNDMLGNLTKSLAERFKRKSRGFPNLPSSYSLLFRELLELAKSDKEGEAEKSDKGDEVAKEQKLVKEVPAQEKAVVDAVVDVESSSEKEEVFGIKEKHSDTKVGIKPKKEVEYEEYTEQDLERVFGNLLVEMKDASQKVAKDTEEEKADEGTISFQDEQKPFSDSENVRIALPRLESILDLISEIAINYTQIAYNPVINTLDQGLKNKFTQLTKSVRELQSQGMNLRVFPLQQLFAPLTRTARNLAVKLKKKVDVIRKGEDAELDKSVLQALSDPLVHMIRNAIDHGIETVDERIKAGKPGRGQIILEAKSQGGKVQIDIKDDGRGLNREKILKKAVSLGLVPNDAILTDAEVWKFIFAPGFSTSEEVSEISGRGVGLDVVMRRIERLGGTIKIQSILGKGTHFTLTLPLTLAMVDGFIIRIGSQNYIIPASVVQEVIRPRRDQIRNVYGQEEMLFLRGKNLPIIKLYEFLRSSDAQQNPWDGVLLIIRDTENEFSLMVDCIESQQQVVIKGLGDALANQPGISGCSILSDGSVGLVLNPGEICSFLQQKAGKKVKVA